MTRLAKGELSGLGKVHILVFHGLLSVLENPELECQESKDTVRADEVDEKESGGTEELGGVKERHRIWRDEFIRRLSKERTLHHQKTDPLIDLVHIHPSENDNAAESKLSSLVCTRVTLPLLAFQPPDYRWHILEIVRLTSADPRFCEPHAHTPVLFTCATPDQDTSIPAFVSAALDGPDRSHDYLSTIFDFRLDDRVTKSGVHDIGRNCDLEFEGCFDSDNDSDSEDIAIDEEEDGGEKEGGGFGNGEGTRGGQNAKEEDTLQLLRGQKYYFFGGEMRQLSPPLPSKSGRSELMRSLRRLLLDNANTSPPCLSTPGSPNASKSLDSQRLMARYQNRLRFLESDANATLRFFCDQTPRAFQVVVRGFVAAFVKHCPQLVSIAFDLAVGVESQKVAANLDQRVLRLCAMRSNSGTSGDKLRICDVNQTFTTLQKLQTTPAKRLPCAFQLSPDLLAESAAIAPSSASPNKVHFQEAFRLGALLSFGVTLFFSLDTSGVVDPSSLLRQARRTGSGGDGKGEQEAQADGKALLCRFLSGKDCQSRPAGSEPEGVDNSPRALSEIDLVVPKLTRLKIVRMMTGDAEGGESAAETLLRDFDGMKDLGGDEKSLDANLAQWQRELTRKSDFRGMQFRGKKEAGEGKGPKAGETVEGRGRGRGNEAKDTYRACRSPSETAKVLKERWPEAASALEEIERHKLKKLELREALTRTEEEELRGDLRHAPSDHLKKEDPCEAMSEESSDDSGDSDSDSETYSDGYSENEAEEEGHGEVKTGDITHSSANSSGRTFSRTQREERFWRSMLGYSAGSSRGQRSSLSSKRIEKRGDDFLENDLIDDDDCELASKAVDKSLFELSSKDVRALWREGLKLEEAQLSPGPASLLLKSLRQA